MIYRDQLEAVYRLIEDPRHWVQNRYAADAAGEPICDEYGDEIQGSGVALDERASCWCLWGAAVKCGLPKDQDEEFVRALGFKFDSDPNDFNDTHTHSEVLALLKAAIERARVRP